ncbi:MAG: hypothetical protein ACRDT6_11940 [Micromonosporaceae bacterium]
MKSAHRGRLQGNGAGTVGRRVHRRRVVLEGILALALGYAVSAAIQAFVSRREAAEHLGGTGNRRRCAVEYIYRVN